MTKSESGTEKIATTTKALDAIEASPAHKSGQDSTVAIAASHSVQLQDIKVMIPDWTFIRQQDDCSAVLENPNRYQLPIEVVVHQNGKFLKVGNSTYMVTQKLPESTPVNLEKINAIGNYSWFKFYNRKYAQVIHNIEFRLPFDDFVSHEALRLYPVNKILNPSLVPSKVSADVLARVRAKLLRIFEGRRLGELTQDDLKRIKYDFYMLINYLAIISNNGNSQDYYDTQNVLTSIKQWINNGALRDITPFDLPQSKMVKNADIIKLILDLKGYLLLCRTGANWIKWKRLKKSLSGTTDNSEGEGQQKTGRTKTIFERKVTPARLHIPATLVSKKNGNADSSCWKVVRVTALGQGDLEPLAGKWDVKKSDELECSLESKFIAGENEVEIPKKYLTLKRRAAVYGFGETLIGNAIMLSLAFAGGSATTVKKILGKNKLVHLALKVRTRPNSARWISLLHARAGMILGQNPQSKIVFITNVEGINAGESDSSTLEFLGKEYPHELSRGQIYTVNQRNGFILDPETGEPLRYKDGHLAIVAENHLWAFFAILLAKNRAIDIIQNTTGIVSLGNGDNILNYPRAGMLGEIEYARRLQGRSVATVAIAALSAGDRKGGFVAKVTYRNSETGDEFSQLELREISEFPTRGTFGFSAIDISGEQSSEFYKLATDNRWFIEDIFKNADGTEKQVAFNVAFYAVDLRLIISRIFGLNENDRDLVSALKQISDQEWVDKIIEIGEKVPAIEHMDKGAPNEDGSEEVHGYMTEQMVQDFIVNALGLLGSSAGQSRPEVVIRLCERKDFFLPYKGKNQYELDEEGNPITDSVTGEPSENYDLIANQKRYVGVIRDHLEDGHRLVLGTHDHVTEIIPIDLDMVKDANKIAYTEDRFLFQRNNL